MLWSTTSPEASNNNIIWEVLVSTHVYIGRHVDESQTKDAALLQKWWATVCSWLGERWCPIRLGSNSTHRWLDTLVYMDNLWTWHRLMGKSYAADSRKLHENTEYQSIKLLFFVALCFYHISSLRDFSIISYLAYFHSEARHNFILPNKPKREDHSRAPQSNANLT